MKKILLLITITAFSFKIKAQNVNIPDATFKSYLVGNSSINTNGDTEIQVSEATTFGGSININNANISDLTGLEEFTSLTSLSFTGNNVSSLDISANTALEDLYCGYNELTSLDVSSNPNLYTIDATNNNLTDITFGNHPFLSFLGLNTNSLSSLDVSSIPDLTTLRFAENELTSLDLSSSASLFQLNCSYNNLTSLNVANGANMAFITAPGGAYLFSAIQNPNLTCIQVDDAAWSTTNWSQIDATASFSENCPVLVDSILVQGQGGVSTITTNGGTLQMEVEVLPANADNSAYSWSLYYGTGTANLDANGILTATSNGTVEVVATANDASEITGSKVITISNQTTNPGTGINDLSFENLSIFPNPTNGIINLDISENFSSIRIMDLTGKIIKAFNSEATQLDISEFTSGIYFLEAANAKKKSIIKIIKK